MLIGVLVVVKLLIVLGLSKLTICHRNFRRRTISKKYIYTVLLNAVVQLMLVYVVCSFKDSLFCNSTTFNIFHIIIYLLVVDALYYWMHRITHRVPLLKKMLHMTHHDTYHLLPSDIYYTSTCENVLYSVVLLLLPFLFLKITLSEYIIALLTAFMHQLYTHSDMSCKFPIPLFNSSKYHKLHHQVGKGNYGVYFSIWDDYMNTRIRRKRQQLKKG